MIHPTVKAPRYAVRWTHGWLGANKGNDWRTGKATYSIVPQSHARLWHRKADATKAANAMGGGLVVPVELTFQTP